MLQRLSFAEAFCEKIQMSDEGKYWKIVRKGGKEGKAEKISVEIRPMLSISDRVIFIQTVQQQKSTKFRSCQFGRIYQFK